jgi:hypothetical protein
MKLIDTRVRWFVVAVNALLVTAFLSPAWSVADDSFRATAKEIDRRLADYWQAKGISPANRAEDTVLLRRLTLDLLGRIPTQAEWEGRLKDGKPLQDQYPRLVGELLESPEFSLHMGAVLDEVLQGPAAGNVEFTDYLRRSIRNGKPWDVVFREIMTGPWDTPERKAAIKFLDVRAKDLDKLTTDTTRVFFGVDISCARCHDHPLVDDWKQSHYYGMASFFNRTSGGKGQITEKNEGDVTFKGADGTQQTAKVMFLSGSMVTDPQEENGKKPKVSRRQQLVEVALQDQKFFSRAFVNRMWHQYFGYGLVEPVDQIHSGNSPSVPGLLEWLAEDFVASGYNVKHVVGAIVSSQAYQLSSRWEASSSPPYPGDFAVRRLRLLSPRQYAFSVLIATGRADFSEPSAIEKRADQLAGNTGSRRIAQYLTMEQQAAELLKNLDPTSSEQTSAAEALFLSNNPSVQQLFAVDEHSLAARLTELKQPADIAEAAIRAVYCRPALPDEKNRLASWIERQQSPLPQTCEQLVWVLVTSAEFRFQH